MLRDKISKRTNSSGLFRHANSCASWNPGILVVRAGRNNWLIFFTYVQCDHLQPCKKFLQITFDRIHYRGWKIYHIFTEPITFWSINLKNFNRFSVIFTISVCFHLGFWKFILKVNDWPKGKISFSNISAHKYTSKMVQYSKRTLGC